MPAGPDLYNLEIVFTGNAVVTQPYAAGNLGQAFIQFLDQSYNSVAFVAVDVTTLGPDGAFSLTATTPADGLNIIQIGFRNSGIEGTSGQMTISNVLPHRDPRAQHLRDDFRTAWLGLGALPPPSLSVDSQRG